MRTIRKALVAGGFTAATALGTAMLDGALTLPETVIAVGMGMVAGAATYQVPNRVRG